MSMLLPELLKPAAPLIVVLPPPTACRKPMPLLPETESVPKVRVPEALLFRLIPSVPPEQVVLPKSALALEPVIRMHCVVLPEIEVPPVAVSEPVTEPSVMPCAVLESDWILVNVAASAPLVRLRAPPVPLSNNSRVVSVPKLAPEAILNPPVLPMVKPRKVLLAPTARLMPLTAPAVVITGGALPVEGRGSLPGGTATPTIDAKDALAPSPISCWLFSSVTPPVKAAGGTGFLYIKMKSPAAG